MRRVRLPGEARPALAKDSAGGKQASRRGADVSDLKVPSGTPQMHGTD